MANIIKGLLWFGIGFGVGAVAASFYNKRKYNDDLDKVAQQIKKDFENEAAKNEPEKKFVVVENPEEKAKAAKDKPSITNYTNMYKEGTSETNVDQESYQKVISPRLISENDLYSNDGNQYAGKTLVLYSDGILADTDMKVVKNIKELIGDDILERFYGTEEEETIFVRNDDTMTDYEILKSSDLYTQVLEETSEEEE